MTVNYEVRLGKNLAEAWATFLKAPEVFIAIMLGQFALSFVLPRIPAVGFFLWLLVASLTIPAFVVVAETVRKNGRAKFDCLRDLPALAPRLIAVAVIKYAIVGAGFVLFFFPGVYLLTIYAFAEVVAVVEKKSFWPALETSRALVKGHWIPVFGLVFTAGLILLAGVMLLGVGMLVSVPVATLVLHAAYRDIRSQVGVLPQVMEARIVT